MDPPPKSATAKFRVWMLPSWLGLDAPCVVCTWAWAVSRALGRTLRVEVYAALLLACWAIYLSDRLVDVARCRDWSQVTGRMRFGRRFRGLFVACLALVLAGLAALLVSGRVAHEAGRGLWVGLAVLGYGALFVIPVFSREKLPGKEFGVGLVFSLAIWAAFGSQPGIAPLLAGCWALVTTNCLVIAARDAETDGANDPGGASQWWPHIHHSLPAIGMVGVLWAVAFAEAIPFFTALALAFAGLTLLQMIAARISADAVRAIADFCLLTPWLTAIWEWLR